MQNATIEKKTVNLWNIEIPKTDYDKLMEKKYNEWKQSFPPGARTPSKTAFLRYVIIKAANE